MEELRFAYNFCFDFVISREALQHPLAVQVYVVWMDTYTK